MLNQRDCATLGVARNSQEQQECCQNEEIAYANEEPGRQTDTRFDPHQDNLRSKLAIRGMSTCPAASTLIKQARREGRTSCGHGDRSQTCILNTTFLLIGKVKKMCPRFQWRPVPVTLRHLVNRFLSLRFHH